MAAHLDISVELSFEDALALTSAVADLPKTWSVTLFSGPTRDRPQIRVTGPGFVISAELRGELIVADAIRVLSAERKQRGV